MKLNNLFIFTKNNEDSKCPLLGLNLKGLYMFGLLQHDSRRIRYFFHFINFTTALFVISQFIDLYVIWEDYRKMLLNMSVSGLSLVAYTKTISFYLFQSRIITLNRSISQAETMALQHQRDFEVKIMKEYTLYVKVVTNMYWVLFFATHIVTILSPFVKYATNATQRENVKNGAESYPQILSSWFPFDDARIPGYLFSIFTHVVMTTQGAGVIATYDAYAMAVMIYLKGQFIILREKCGRMFEDDAEILSEAKFLVEIKECHRHHNLLLKQYKMYNSITSPVMFVYVICCSITICCSIVQLNLDNISASEKFRVFEYVAALGVQLFFYCWHSNEVAIASQQVDLGVYESKWWKADPRERKMVALLAGKLATRFIINAGPFKELSIPTFIDMMKGTYSFYTLFTQMQEKRS